MARSKRHIHKYHKLSVAGEKVWACALPNCSHYMPKHMEQLVIGKGSFCWLCNEPIVLDVTNMQNDKPTCRACNSSDVLKDFVSSL